MQDRMRTAHTPRPLPLRAVEPLTAPDADPIDHADQAVTDDLNRKIDDYLRKARDADATSLSASGLLIEAFHQFADATELYGHMDGGSLTYTAPDGSVVSIDIGPFTARKVAKALLGAMQDAGAYAGIPAAPRVRRPHLVPAPVQS